MSPTLHQRQHPAHRLVVFCQCAVVAVTALLMTASANAQAPRSTVAVDTVREEALVQTVPVIGQLVARRAGDVAARVAGAVEEFEVQIGDRVAEGDVIAHLDDRVLVARLAQIQARSDEAKARRDTARAQLALALQERDRLARLKSTQATSRAQYDDAVKSAAIASSRVREAQAAIATAEADLRFAEIDVEYATVRAPYSGVIMQRFAEVGAYVKVGDPLVSMLANANLEVEADVPFDRLTGLTPGAKVVLTLDSDIQMDAMVRAVVPDENPLTRTRAVRFVAEFGDGIEQLARGQSITVRIPTGAPRNVVTVHKDGINRRGDNTLVFVVVDGTAKIRPVKLGVSVGNRLEVLDGLKPGEKVVVRGNERLRPDDKVDIGHNS